MSPNRKLFAAISVTALLAFPVAGCGGDDKKNSEFVAQANAICKDSYDSTQVAREEAFAGEPTPEDVTNFFTDTAIPNAQSTLDQLSELTPPEDTQEEFDKVLAAAKRGIADAEALVKDPEAVQAPVSSESIEGPFNDPFFDFKYRSGLLGLAECED